MLPMAGVALSALLFYVSTGLGTFWPAAWLAPLPVLLAALRSRSRIRAWCYGASAYFLGSLNVWSYLGRLVPLPILVALLLLPAAVFGLVILASRYAYARLPGWAAAFAFPAAWTAYEFLFAQVSPHGTASNLAYTQVDFLPLLQLASVTGLWGVSFLLLLIPSAVAVAWLSRSVRPVALPAAMLAAALVFGAVRLRAPESGPIVRVGLAAADSDPEVFDTEDPRIALASARTYVERAGRAASRGAQVVILPEKIFGVTPAGEPDVRRVFSEAARRLHITLVVGWNEVGVLPRRNVAVVFAPDGEAVLEYTKRHMLPGSEIGYAIGTAPGLFHPPGTPWGLAICKDMDFPAWLRGYGRRGARTVAVPAWDFVVDGRWHSRMAVMRGVENGFSMARAARQGLLTFSDAYGRILAETPSSTAPEALLLRDLGPGPGATFYTRTGDWFGWISVALLATLMGSAARRKPRLQRFVRK
jgi:apolipoprotein N-acyltransferase